jgi:hypothetical protein
MIENNGFTDSSYHYFETPLLAILLAFLLLLLLLLDLLFSLAMVDVV